MEENYYVDVNMQRNGKTKAQIHAASPKKMQLFWPPDMVCGWFQSIQK